jgi:hypothetical protein
MTRHAAFRVLRHVAIGLIGFLVLITAILRIQTYLFRQRAERLMADFQTLKLRETPWPVAESLMSRWGKYGGYKGDCAASFCRYTIVLQSPESRLESSLVTPAVVRSYYFAYASAPFRLGEILGGRWATVRTTFVVQDGTVVRKSASFIYNVPKPHPGDGYSLIATSRAASRLTDYRNWPLIGSNQLVKHPYYAVTSPGGCTFCLMANVTFTPDAPEAEMRRLTTFNLNCLTRLMSCRYLEDIYPAAEEWHLYDGTYGGRPEPGNKASYAETVQPLGCKVPVFARGREADWIFSVVAVQESQERHPGEIVETAKVRLESILKGSTTYKPGQLLDVVSHSSYPSTPLAIETPLTPGLHFLIIPLTAEVRSQPIELERCLALPDTPEIRAQLQQGISENDSLRYPDPSSTRFIPE